MKIAICDDNLKICAEISSLIRSQISDAEIFIFYSKNDLLQAEENFSIFFLDIKAVDGIEIAKIIRRRQEIFCTPKSILIFVTGYENFMSDAFDVHAFHYLLKPIDTEKFSKILSQAVTEIKNFETQAEKFLLIKIGGAAKKIFLRDIFYIESQNKKIAIHTTENIFEVYGKMDAYEIALAESFFRCHRGYLVNFAKISAYNSNEIKLCNGEKIFMSAKKFPEFVKNFLRYAQNGGLVNV
ncbi:MAG: response regulator transcription factor [Selenomonadaceae bacterium]|nr:response regulator transcription factor [Selenomonadaceae bacterium]MBQ7628702.1 response regulator transcription factor [Selenomonadaceae bacterium]